MLCALTAGQQIAACVHGAIINPVIKQFHNDERGGESGRVCSYMLHKSRA